MIEELICTHDPADPNHLICESKNPRRHRWINVFLAGGVLWFIFLSGLVLWIILSRGEGGDSLQTLPDPRLGTRAVQSPVDSNVPTVPPSSSAGSNSFLIEDSTGRPAGFLGEDPAGSATQLGEEKSLDYSGQTEPYLEAEAVYFSKEGEQVGRGPWPPKPREKTRLKVFLKLGGLASPIAIGEARPPDIAITAELGPNIEWTGFAPMGAGLTYEPATRKVRFIPREGNTAVFEVGITPTAKQLEGKQLIIIGNLKMILDNREILSPNILIGW